MCQVYRSTAKKGFWLAGLYNWVTILGLNQFFTSNVLAETDPIVFSWMGQVLILLWGAVYFWRAHRFNQHHYSQAYLRLPSLSILSLGFIGCLISQKN